MNELTDTLIIDQERLSYWQSDPAFDYNSELLVKPPVQRENVFLQWLEDVIDRILEFIFGRSIDSTIPRVILIVLIICLILLIIWFLYKKRRRWMEWFRDSRTPYEVTEDTIYGVDFDADIRTALAQENYREAVRLIYLKTLKRLSDEQLILWELSKTPTEYMYELQQEAMRPVFRKLTNQFLQVRYGNFDATRQTFECMQGWQDELFGKGGMS